MKPTPQLAILAVLALAVSPTRGALVVDTFSNVSALTWDTVNTAPSKTVHFTGTNTGVGFDVTLATNQGNLVTGDYKPGGVSYLSDSGGINGMGWFEGTLTITVGNFTGAALGDISFQLQDVSGRRLVTDSINFTSTATPTTTVLLGTPWNTDAAFSNIGLDSSAANMAGGSYVATLPWKNMDAETSGLYRFISFELGVDAVPEPASFGLLCLGSLSLLRRRRA